MTAPPASASAHPDAAAIREQLDRLLTNPHIRNSKRCHTLLRHIVESAVAGSLDGLKERSLGCDVFHREPDYDTNQDSIVRTTAAEIRKRLAQYYLEPGHEHELRVSLPAGSYVPEFRQAATFVALPAPTRPASKRRWLWAAAPVLIAAAALAWELTPPPIDRLWQPVLSDSAEPVICIGQPTRIYRFDSSQAVTLNDKMVGSDIVPPVPVEERRNTALTLNDLRPTGERYFASGDATAALRVAAWLGRNGKSFRILGEKTAEYRDLRGKPVVLIGLSNNKWTLGLMSQMRYYIDRHSGQSHYAIRDRRDGDKAIAAADQGETAAEEYAIVSRVFDRSVEKNVFIIAGMADRSTSGAGEFLTNDSYVRDAFAKAPSGWYKQNIEIVLATQLVGGVPGPPRVVAEWFW